jgi:hypothetical protein
VIQEHRPFTGRAGGKATVGEELPLTCLCRLIERGRPAFVSGTKIVLDFQSMCFQSSLSASPTLSPWKQRVSASGLTCSA